MDKIKIILSTALRLFVEDGFHGTATAKIAKESGVANGTLFNYYSTKDILIINIYQNIVQNKEAYIIEKMNANSVSKEAFYSLFVATINWNLENPTEHHYLQQFKHSPYSKTHSSVIEKIQEQPLYVLIQNAIDLVVVKQLEVGYIYTLFNSQIDGLYEYILANDFDKTKQSQLIEDTFEIIWKMIKE